MDQDRAAGPEATRGKLSPALMRGAPDGDGSVHFKRRTLITSGPGWGEAEVEDLFHHFRVRLLHDGAAVTGVEATAVRHPWTLCPAASAQLQLLVGMPLSGSVVDVGRWTPARQQCMHQFDLAGLAMAGTVAGRPRRCYDISISRLGPLATGELERDGVRLLRWTYGDDLMVVDPPGISLGRGFLRALQELDPDDAEAAFVLRRACVIGRAPFDMNDWDSADGAGVMGSCWVFQPERVAQALRADGMQRDVRLLPIALR